jgi:hypothetical protein
MNWTVFWCISNKCKSKKYKLSPIVGFKPEMEFCVVAARDLCHYNACAKNERKSACLLPKVITAF